MAPLYDPEVFVTMMSLPKEVKCLFQHMDMLLSILSGAQTPRVLPATLKTGVAYFLAEPSPLHSSSWHFALAA